MLQKSNKNILTLGLVLAVIVAGLSFAYVKYYKPCDKNKNTNTRVSETADWKTYTNSVWGFSFKYPKEWSMACDKLPKEIIEESEKDDILKIGVKASCEEGSEVDQEISVMINPPDILFTGSYKYLEIEKKEEGGFEITGENIYTPESYELSEEYYYAYALSEWGAEKRFLIEYKESLDKDNEDLILKKILPTFEFTDTSSSVTFCTVNSDCQHDCGIEECLEKEEATYECVESECVCGCLKM